MKKSNNMEATIEEITFHMTDDQTVKVTHCGGARIQYHVTPKEVLDPQFLSELWGLLYSWQFIDCHYNDKIKAMISDIYDAGYGTEELLLTELYRMFKAEFRKSFKQGVASAENKT